MILSIVIFICLATTASPLRLIANNHHQPSTLTTHTNNIRNINNTITAQRTYIQNNLTQLNTLPQDQRIYKLEALIQHIRLTSYDIYNQTISHPNNSNYCNNISQKMQSTSSQIQQINNNLPNNNTSQTLLPLNAINTTVGQISSATTNNQTNKEAIALQNATNLLGSGWFPGSSVNGSDYGDKSNVCAISWPYVSENGSCISCDYYDVGLKKCVSCKQFDEGNHVCKDGNSSINGSNATTNPVISNTSNLNNNKTNQTTNNTNTSINSVNTSTNNASTDNSNTRPITSPSNNLTDNPSNNLTNNASNNNTSNTTTTPYNLTSNNNHPSSNTSQPVTSQRVSNPNNLTGLILPSNKTPDDYQKQLLLNTNQVNLIPCPTQTPFFDGTKCITCPSNQYFSSTILTCQTCPQFQTYNAATYHCQKVKYYSNIANPSWISVGSAPSDVITNITKSSAMANYKPCPTATPFFDGKDCIVCVEPSPIYSYDANKCSSCVSPTIFDKNLHACVNTVHKQTNPNTANNLIFSGRPLNEWNAYYFNNQTSDKTISDCPANVPYFDGATCITCPVDTPYFNLEFRVCQSCEKGESYDAQSRECFSVSSGNIVTQEPSLMKMAASIFG